VRCLSFFFSFFLSSSSLLTLFSPTDMLNSEPPSWVNNQSPEINSLPIVVETPQRSGTFGSKIRSRFASNGPGSNGGGGISSEDFSTLRPSRSASNLLSNFRKPGGGSVSSKKSVQPDKDSSDSTRNLLSHTTSNVVNEADEFGTMSPPRPRKLSTKPATAATSSTRDLADFLRDSAPPPSLFGKENASATSLPYRNRSGSTKTNNATGNHHASKLSRSGSIDTSSSGTAKPTVAGVKAAMVRLGRRASLTPFSAAMMVSPPVSAAGASISSPVQPPLTPAFSEQSEDGTGTIRVDQQLMDGLFGFQAKPLVMSPTSRVGGPLDVERELRAKEEEKFGVREFVEVDEKEGVLPIVTVAGEGPAAFVGGQRPKREGAKTRKESLQVMAGVSGLVRGASGSSRSSSSHSPCVSFLPFLLLS
jgi:hypothetical protein